MAKVYLVVTAVGRDKRGTVEKITNVVVEHHANIEESKMARHTPFCHVCQSLSATATQPGAAKKQTRKSGRSARC
jgi:glycine cleavage system regulatory protein